MDARIDLHLGPHGLDLEARQLVLKGRRVPIPEKPFLVLEALLESPGRVRTREELRRRLWPRGTWVDFDNSLNSAVATLRTLLRDTARRPRFIETVPRVGYRLVAPVRRPVPPAAPARRGRVLALSAAATLLVTLLAAAGALLLDARAPDLPGPALPAGSPRAGTPAMSSQAREAYNRGLYLLSREDPEHLPEALESLERAAWLDPAAAAVHAARAEALLRSAFASPTRRIEHMERARQAAERAAGLDGGLALPHRILAAVALHVDWDFRRAREHMRRALRLDPGDSRTQLAAAALLSVLGHHDEAVARARRAVNLDPSSSYVRADLGWFYLAAGRNEEALRASLQVLEAAPDFSPAWRFLLLAADRLKRLDRAAMAARRIMELEGGSPASLDAIDWDDPAAALDAFRAWDLRRTRDSGTGDPLQLALAHAALSHKAEALRYLEEAYRSREAFLVFVGGFPQLDSLRDEPGFAALMGRMGLSPAGLPGLRSS